MSFERALLVGCTVALAAGCGGKARAEHDPPRIVPWSSIGDARIGWSRGQIHRVYGKPSSRGSLRKYWPATTKYFHRDVTEETYRVPGGALYVRYVDGVVKEVGTTSPRYKTSSGIRVGITVSRGPCRPNDSGSCEYTWGRFSFDDCTNDWYSSGRDVDVEIGMNRSLFAHRQGRIVWIGFGDPNVVLHCF